MVLKQTMKSEVLNSFFFVENPNFIQVAAGWLEFEIRVKKVDNRSFIIANDLTNESIRLVNNAFAFTSHDVGISTSSGTEIKQKNWLVLFRPQWGKYQSDGDVATYFDIFDKSEDGGKIHPQNIY